MCLFRPGCLYEPCFYSDKYGTFIWDDMCDKTLSHYRSSLQWHLTLEHWLKANALDLLCFIIVVLATIGTIMLLGYHTNLMFTGQTTWEQVSRHRILYLKDLEMLINPFDEGCCKNMSTFLCNCRHIGRNWETIYSKGVYR